MALFKILIGSTIADVEDQYIVAGYNTSIVEQMSHSIDLTGSYTVALTLQN